MQPPKTPDPSKTTPPDEVGAQTFILEPPPGGSFLVRARYPHRESECKDATQPKLLARYPGKLTAVRAQDGTISLTVTLTFEKYLEGIAEVPSSWPMAALQAQAIAARSYALATTGWTGEGQSLDSPICSTTACQVYRGIPVPPVPTIGRWRRAVRSTAGQMLVYQGRPATTVYFSTSKGRTLGNEEVFGSSPLPYLRSVPENDEGSSPTRNWKVSLPFGDLGTFLAKAGLWPEGEKITRVVRSDSGVRVSGPEQERVLDVADFRAGVNQWAPCLMPERYPGNSRFGSPLPLTVPSGWFSSSGGDGAVVLTGRGWGHGVGMSQWGAYGKAKQGMSAADILAAYYGGLRPVQFPEPQTIQVQVASGLRTVSIRPSGKGATLNGKKISGNLVVIGGALLLH